MTLPSRHDELLAAHHAVHQAAIVTRAAQKALTLEQRISKADDSPVTIADFAAQAVVKRELRRRLPALAPVLAEEHADYLRDPSRAALLHSAVEAARLVWPDVTTAHFLASVDDAALDPLALAAPPAGQPPAAFWTLDPIDGTKGFIRGHQYSICLAKIERGRVVVAALACPNLSPDFERPFEDPDPRGLTFLACEGEPTICIGADQAPNPAKWTPLDLAEARQRASGGTIGSPARPLRLCGSYSATRVSDSAAAAVIARLQQHGVHVAPPVRLDSQVKYAVVARGQMDAFLRMPRSSTHEENIWDHAPGSLIAQQAGAVGMVGVVVTDCVGRPLNFEGGATLRGNRGLLVARRELHDQLEPFARLVLGN